MLYGSPMSGLLPVQRKEWNRCGRKNTQFASKIIFASTLCVLLMGPTFQSCTYFHRLLLSFKYKGRQYSPWPLKSLFFDCARETQRPLHVLYAKLRPETFPVLFCLSKLRRLPHYQLPAFAIRQHFRPFFRPPTVVPSHFFVCPPFKSIQ